MEEKSKSNNFFQCLGICHRLFTFIMSNLIPIGLKRVATTSQSLRQGQTAVPIFSAMVQPNQNKVEHHHQAQISEAHERAPVEMSEEDQEMLRKKKGKSVMIVSRVEKEEKVGSEEVKLQNDPPRPRPPPRQRQVRPLFDVAVNINEKSDAFIRSRKEAMRRNYYFETQAF